MKHTEETKKRISETLKGRISPMKGRTLSDEHKRKISESGKGNKRGLGKKHSQETKDKISAASMKRDPWNKGTKGKFSKESREKMSISQKKRWAKMSIDEKANHVKYWHEASLKVKVSSIEYKIRDVLFYAGIDHEVQVPFSSEESLFIADIYVPSKNTIIECNGDYWHNLPDRKIRDKKVQKYCDKNNIKLLWIWESEINKDPLQALKNAIKESKCS